MSNKANHVQQPRAAQPWLKNPQLFCRLRHQLTTMQIAVGTVGLSSQVVDIFVTEITLAYTSTSTSSNVTLNSINPQTARSDGAWYTSTSEECRGMGVNANYFSASSVGYLCY
jgi:hypothetical protein